MNLPKTNDDRGKAEYDIKEPDDDEQSVDEHGGLPVNDIVLRLYGNYLTSLCLDDAVWRVRIPGVKFKLINLNNPTQEHKDDYVK